MQGPSLTFPGPLFSQAGPRTKSGTLHRGLKVCLCLKGQGQHRRNGGSRGQSSSLR